MRSKILAAVAAASLVAGSSVAAAAQAVAPAAPASAVDRTGAGMEDSSELRRGGTVLIIGAIVLALLVWGIIELTKDDDDAPISP